MKMKTDSKNKKSRLKLALQQTQDDLNAGRFKTTTVEEHVEEVRTMKNIKL